MDADGFTEYIFFLKITELSLILKCAPAYFIIIFLFLSL